MTNRFLLAPGAGAPSSSAGMRRLAQLLAGLGSVRSFDYPYMQAAPGVRPPRRAPNKLPELLATHRKELAALRASSEAGDRLLLCGKSMGGRIGCHLALEEPAAGLVCFGYPLRGQNGKLRDEVLIALRTPVLFVQGTRDELCSLDELALVRERMSARSELHVVEGGNHSLEVTKTALRAQSVSMVEVDAAIVKAVGSFCDSL